MGLVRVAALALLAGAGCTVGPHYVRPDPEAPANLVTQEAPLWDTPLSKVTTPGRRSQRLVGAVSRTPC